MILLSNVLQQSYSKSESAKGLHEILVSPYVHPITQNRILSSLQTMKVNYQYRNPLDKFTKFRSFNSMFESPVDHSELEQAAKDRSEPSENFPEVVIATGNQIDGVEYGSVILLLDRSLPVWWDGFIFDSMYIAFTRATTHLSIVINNNEEPPMIIVPHGTSLQSIDCKPTISAYTSLIMPIDEYSTKIDEIIKDSHWSKDPVLIVGNCVRKPTYFKETNSYDKNHSFCFSGPGDKEVVVYSEFVAMWRSFESSASEYATSSVYRYDQRFSAFVFVCHTYKDYVELCNSVMRHRLLYFLYENQLSICPFYILLPHPMPTSRLSSRLNCDFLSSEFKNKEKQSLHCSGVDSPIDSLPWYLLKEHGTAFLKSGDLKSALTNYKKSLQCLQDYCDKILQNETIQTLIAIFENISCL